MSGGAVLATPRRLSPANRAQVQYFQILALIYRTMATATKAGYSYHAWQHSLLLPAAKRGELSFMDANKALFKTALSLPSVKGYL